jgi:WD40 repeat protein
MELSASDWEYVGERAGSFVGREWVFARVRSFLSGPPGTFLLRGDPGTGKTAIAARLAQASSGRGATDYLPAQSAVAEGTVSAAVFCRAEKAFVPDLIKDLSRQLARSVEGFAAAFLTALPEVSGKPALPQINIKDVRVEAGEVHTGAELTGVVINFDIAINALSDDDDMFMQAVAVPLRHLRELDAAQPIVVLVDAVDEAAAVGKVNTFSAGLGKLSGIHLIVTCRSDTRVLVDFRKAGHQVDLIVDAPPGDADVDEYVRNRLRGIGSEDAIAAIADRIAREAAGNFLYAFYVTGALAQSASLDRIDREAARGLRLPTGGLPGVYEDFLDRQIGGDDAKWTEELRPVLAPLCVALGDGFTTAQLGAIASRLTGRDFSITKAGDVTRAAGQFLDGPRPKGPFRVYHQSFTRFLTDPQQNPYWPIDATEANNAVVQALSGAVAEDREGVKNWAKADPYAKKYLATHAAISGRLDDFLMDAGYLLAADPSRLLAVLSKATTAAGRSAAGVLRRAAHQYQTCSREEAASYLEVQAHQSGFPALAEQVARLDLARPWAAPWAQWRRPQQRMRLAPDEEITAMTIGVFRSERIAVLATKSGQLQIRRVTDGTNALEPFMTHDPGLEVPPITMLTAGEVDGEPVVLFSDSSGSVKAWNLLANPPAQTFQSNHGTSVVALALTDINGVLAVLSVSRSEGRLWRWSDGAIISSFNFNEYVRAAAIGRYEHVPLIGYAGHDRVDFRVIPGHAPIGDGEAPWPNLWHYDLFMPDSPRHYDDVIALAFLQVADRTTVISGDKKGYIWTWDIKRYAKESSEIAPIGRHQHPLIEEGGSGISAVAIAEASGRKIAASGDSAGKIKVWDVAQSRQIGDLPTAHTSEIKSLAVTDIDGSAVVISCAQDAVRIWDLDELGSPDQPEITALTFASLHGTKVLLVGDSQGTVQVLQLADGLPAAPTFHGHRGEVTAIAVHTIGGEIVAISGGADGTVQVWNPADATRLGDPYTEHGRVVTAVAARQVGGRLLAASGGYDKTVRIWDVASRAPLGDPIRLGATVPLGGVAFAELGTRSAVVTAADSRRPSIVQLWDLSDRTPIGSAVTLDDGAFGAVTAIQLGAQPLIVFSDYEGIIRLRGFTDRSRDVDFQCSEPGWSRGLAATTSDGQPVIMTGSHQNGVIDVWYVHSGRHQRIDIGSAIYALATGPDRTLAVGTGDGVILIRLLDAVSL